MMGYITYSIIFLRDVKGVIWNDKNSQILSLDT